MQITKNNLIKLSQGEIDDLIDWAARFLTPRANPFPNVIMLDHIDQPQDMLTSRVVLLLEGLTKVDHDLHAERFWGVAHEHERYSGLPAWTYDETKRKPGIERWQGPKHWGWGEKHTVRVMVTAAKIRDAMAKAGVDLSKYTINTVNGPRPIQLPNPDDRYGNELVAAWREHRRQLSAGTRAKNATIKKEVRAEVAMTPDTDIERMRLMETNRKQEREIARLRALLSEKNVDSSQIKQLQTDLCDLMGVVDKLTEDNAKMADFIAKVQEQRIEKERRAKVAERIAQGLPKVAVRGFEISKTALDAPWCYHDYVGAD
jgi:hypothetical protein